MPNGVLAARRGRAPSGRRRKNQAATRGDVRRAAGLEAPRVPDRQELVVVEGTEEPLLGLRKVPVRRHVNGAPKVLRKALKNG